ncbi:M24 family metallopeptidase [Chondrinema litorale]|uniref:M24 family metallopeptidase n=1 Tax=Chondrinema litorale TaxID=2994555 RepID=UPI002542B99D|nr:M24 family metallopeptidase [Chondrinema litorale]UZR94415.1 M24 family metallopeptidase [Chondrinema litorale]
MRKLLLLSLFTFLSTVLLAQSNLPVILSMRDRAKIQDDLLEDKIRSVLPTLMDRAGIDMWVITAREYNEDPVIETMLPATWLAARRRTILVLYKPKGTEEIEALAIARYDVGTVFKKSWDKESQPDQWKALLQIIEERNPEKIGINKSEHFAHADGITASEYDNLMATLPQNYRNKIVSAENLAVAWLETRTPREMAIYEQICRIAHVIIAEGFSDKVIQPGVTTTDDVVWWFRERIKELRLDTWFHPTVDIQRNNPTSELYAFSGRPGFNVIQPGDLLHCDFGITYLGLNTDTQELAYVLKAGETDAPEYLKAALMAGNRAQDILTNQYQTGKTGNQILASALEQAGKESNRATIYTHPIGYHGHAAGPTIGMWDNQGDTPFRGDYSLYPNTAYSIELNTKVFIEAWNKDIRVMLEEDAFFDGEKVRYIDGRQESLLLIPKPANHLGNLK